jgi:hypothetical protein
MEMITEQVMLLRNTMLLLYSPKCVEGEFSEVHKEYARRWRRVRKDAIVPNNMR